MPQFVTREEFDATVAELRAEIALLRRSETAAVPLPGGRSVAVTVNGPVTEEMLAAIRAGMLRGFGQMRSQFQQRFG